MRVTQCLSAKSRNRQLSQLSGEKNYNNNNKSSGIQVPNKKKNTTHKKPSWGFTFTTDPERCGRAFAVEACCGPKVLFFPDTLYAPSVGKCQDQTLPVFISRSRRRTDRQMLCINININLYFYVYFESPGHTEALAGKKKTDGKKETRTSAGATPKIQNTYGTQHSLFLHDKVYVCLPEDESMNHTQLQCPFYIGRTQSAGSIYWLLVVGLCGPQAEVPDARSCT